ncbi:MAG: Trm112 family protein, partial [Chloroflexaceae bacterium]
MYAEVLEYLTCPHHPDAPLALEAGERRADDGEIVNGALRCPVCAARYPIVEGIADVLGPIRFPESLTQALNLLPLTAWGYERTWRPQALTLLSGEPFGYERELPLITAMAAPERGGLMVDVACSNGLYARAL